ncbi:MAG: phosphoribosylanthranilate isomerase [Gammaproteobacteria bacterium]|nr:phosphoribosylanthranilate isomerase [Gammaproteobacteria bacterium]
MSITRIKICGISRVEDALYAEKLGVDTIGLVFYKKSPRNVSIEQALEIAASLGGMMGVVGLFHNAIDDEVWSVLEELPQLLPQFHGDEPPEFCEQFSRPYIKAFGMGQDQTPQVSLINDYQQAAAILLDANVPGEMGGTGHSFDWSRIPDGINKPLILAGGLNCANVVPAIQQVRPYAVDVSSGVESERGIKDQALMKEFVQKVRGLDDE